MAQTYFQKDWTDSVQSADIAQFNMSFFSFFWGGASCDDDLALFVPEKD